MYYRKQIDKLNRTRDWRAVAFWLERHEEELVPRGKRTIIVNQVGISMGGKPKITLIFLRKRGLGFYCVS